MDPPFPPAVILAGGLGTRLRPVVEDLPKSMAPVNGKPFLERIVSLLSGKGIREFVFCVGYRREAILGYFGDGSGWNVRIRYATEEEPLGTGGAVRNALPLLDGTFLLLNGDTYLDVDYSEFLEYHRQKVRKERCVGSVALVSTQERQFFGSVTAGKDWRIASFSEKSPDAVGRGWINGGVMCLEPMVLRFIPPDVPSSLERDVIPAAISAGGGFFGFPVQGDFVDIGTPEGYRKIQEILV
ncbi:MAG: Nucleotidyl transferase [Actinobacteria bacterium]|nr:Nucleotidyl transferase [Actinomycetota bacterium]